MANNVKVSGYVKKETFDYGTVEYRNFDPDLVGLQITSNGGTSLFTMGNFGITTNLDPKVDKNYITNNYSEYFTLQGLDLNFEQVEKLLENNAETFLNLNNSNLKNFALFGSMTEYVRINLEDIIIKWPASLYASPLTTIDNIDYIGDTYENYTYNSLTNISTFKVNTNFLSNKFQINYLNNGGILNTFNETNDLRNLIINYSSYVILNNDEEYPIIGFTGSTDILNDYLYFKVKGLPFSATTTNGKTSYHIKPNKTIENTFFNSLTGIQNYLLTRQTKPLYSATFSYPIKTETGIIYTEKTLKWPNTDGYNIDFDNNDYAQYVNNLLNLCTSYDETETSLMNRFLITEAIVSFDTTPVRLAPEHEDTSTGQKINKLLNIYGRSFDDFNQYIKGISLAHTVTYDKQDNLPDKYLKDLARLLGWDLVNTIQDTNLLENYTKAAKSTYSGVTVGLTPAQAEIELWRRLILNTPWIWKSKGSRKSIEMLLELMGIPKGLFVFNEYIYKAKAPIDVDLFTKVLTANNLDTSLLDYPIDSDGYPKPLADNYNDNGIYFQGNGLWFRETGGSGSTIDISTGNNPHVGKYDGGASYINQFRKLIPNFSATTIETTELSTVKKNIFSNYKEGDITNYTGQAYIDILNQDNLDISDCIVYTAEVTEDPMPTAITTDCGCPCEGDDDMLSICLKKNEQKPLVCKDMISYTADSSNGFYLLTKNVKDVNKNIIGTEKTYYMNKECCTVLNGYPSVYTSSYHGGYALNAPIPQYTSGYICCSSKTNCGCNVACDWSIEETSMLSATGKKIITPISIPENSNNKFLRFKTFGGYGKYIVTTIDGSHCPKVLTIPVANILDPYTNEVGFGCRLTQDGLYDLNMGDYSTMLQNIRKKINKTISCC